MSWEEGLHTQTWESKNVIVSVLSKILIQIYIYANANM